MHEFCYVHMCIHVVHHKDCTKTDDDDDDNDDDDDDDDDDVASPQERHLSPHWPQK